MKVRNSATDRRASSPSSSILEEIVPPYVQTLRRIQDFPVKHHAG